MKKRTPFSQAIRLLGRTLKKDTNYYRSWKANIALAFYDEYRRTKGYKSRAILHKIANQSADNFLELLMRSK